MGVVAMPALTKKSRQSERNLQYLMKQMEADGIITWGAVMGRGENRSFHIHIARLRQAADTPAPLPTAQDTPAEAVASVPEDRVQPLLLFPLLSRSFPLPRSLPFLRPLLPKRKN
jgi:hypothetical protein